MRFSFRNDKVLVVFNHNKTTNAKITSGKKPIVQQYSFSKAQYEYLANGGTIMGFIALDGENCLNCPFSYTNKYKLGKCYTHKFPQLRGFVAMVRAIIKEYGAWENIPEIPEIPPAELLAVCSGNYIRFGTYGEPIFVPFNWVEELVGVCRVWTGYTHQWEKKPEYAKYFMASVHNMFEQTIAEDMGWLVFLIAKKIETDKNVLCPSDRANVTCQKCALCSGTQGKGTKSVKILYH